VVRRYILSKRHVFKVAELDEATRGAIEAWNRGGQKVSKIQKTEQ
jgi:hypothetical protein